VRHATLTPGILRRYKPLNLLNTVAPIAPPSPRGRHISASATGLQPAFSHAPLDLGSHLSSQSTLHLDAPLRHPTLRLNAVFLACFSHTLLHPSALFSHKPLHLDALFIRFSQTPLHLNALLYKAICIFDSWSLWVRHSSLTE
jgi:hypothetical protein